ncbi:MAG: hypothetical protein NTX88_12215 [Candidatus Atribacteria bacterium]|nr:hypothetical protein [Candidatus Atribacteria bacterium]
MKKWVLFSLLLFLLTSPVGCVSRNNPLSGTLDFSSELIFVESWRMVSAQTLSGEGIPAMMIDFPNYRYDQKTGTLTSFVEKFGVGENKIDTASIHLLLGNGLTLTDDAGGGAISDLYGVNQFPFSLSSDSFYSLGALRDDGKVLIVPASDIRQFDFSFSNPLPLDGRWIAPGETVQYVITEEKDYQDSRIRFTITLRFSSHRVQKDHCLNSAW